MNVCYILNATIPNGGATKAFLNILTGLEGKDVAPVVIVPDKGGIYPDLKQRGIPVYAFTYRECCYSHARNLKEKLLFLPRMMAKLAVNRQAANKVCSILKRHHINLVHTNSGVINIGYRAARKCGIPHIYHIREYGDLDFGKHYFPNKQAFWRQLITDGSYSICITKDIQRYNRQQGRNTSRVIYDGVFHAAKSMPVVQDKDYFLYAGRIEPAKGLDQLLEAYCLYLSNTQHPLKLLVAGSCVKSAYVDQQMAYIARHHLTEKVQLLGECDDIAALMAHARAIIIPSRNEGFGFCMPEAMLQGCLAIARNTGGTKEQLDNGMDMTGKEIALRYETAEELGAMLLEVSTQPVEAYRPYTERAFLVVNQCYTIESNSRQIFQFYQDILHERLS